MLPKQRKSPSQTRQGRSHLALSSTHAVDCPNCGEARHPHRACGKCGYVRPGLTLRAKNASTEQ